MSRLLVLAAERLIGENFSMTNDDIANFRASVVRERVSREKDVLTPEEEVVTRAAKNLDHACLSADVDKITVAFDALVVAVKRMRYARKPPSGATLGEIFRTKGSR